MRALALGALGLAAVSRLTAQTAVGVFRGQVVDSLGDPARFAEIAIVGTKLHAVADTEGLFRIDSVPVGVHPVVVRLIGWKPLFFMIRMEASQEQIVRVGLERLPYRLPELVVKAKPVEKPPGYAFTTRYDDFFRRKRLREGTFRTRDDDWFLSSFGTADLLRGIPGVTVRWELGGSSVEFGRCNAAGDRVGVWIDGARVMERNHDEALQLIRPNDIEAIEVYRSPNQIPAEFRDDACAVIAIWTR